MTRRKTCETCSRKSGIAVYQVRSEKLHWPGQMKYSLEQLSEDAADGKTYPYLKCNFFFSLQKCNRHNENYEESVSEFREDLKENIEECAVIMIKK